MPCYICHKTGRAFVNDANSFVNDASLYVFPLGRPNIVEEWRKFARLPPEADLSLLVLCTKHFKEEDIVSEPQKTYLTKTAVPCLFPPEDEDENNIVQDITEPLCPPALPKVGTNEVAENLALIGFQEDSVNDVCVPIFVPISSIENPEENLVWTEFVEHQTNLTEESNVLDIARRIFCRVCGRKESHLVSIFDTPQTSRELSLSMKIERYLPIKVSADDLLPPNICGKCIHMLHNWHELHATCISADKVHHEVFCGSEGTEENSCASKSSVYNRFEDESDENYGDRVVSNNDMSVDDPMNGVNNKYKQQHVEDEDVTLLKSGDASTDSNTHSNVLKPFFPKCLHCNEFFYYRDDCREHVKECRDLPFLCDVCGEILVHRKYMSKHKKKHRKYKDVFCNLCSKNMSSLRSLKYHKEFVHNKKQPKYYCEGCCIVIQTKCYYQSHMKKHETGEIRTPRFKFEGFSQSSNNRAVFICPVCDDAFIDKLSLITHLNTKKSVRCPTCLRESSSEKQFLLHKCLSWNCGECNLNFSNKQEFDEHMVLHKEIPLGSDDVLSE